MNGGTQLLLLNEDDLDRVIKRHLKSFFDEYMFCKKDEEEKADVLLTEKEVCDRLGVTHATLWNWNKKKYLCHVKIGHRVMWKQSDIDKLLKGER